MISANKEYSPFKSHQLKLHTSTAFLLCHYQQGATECQENLIIMNLTIRTLITSVRDLLIIKLVSFKLFIEKRLEKMRQKTDTLSAASSLLSLNTSSTHMSWEEKSEESSSVFSDATQTGDELDSPRTNSISSNAEQIVEQGVNENSRHNLTDLSDLAINMQSGSAVIESQNCQSDLDYVNLAKKVANEIIESAVVRIKDELTIELEQLANECVNNTLAKVVMESKSLNQNDSWHDETGPLISPYLGTGLKGANYAPALTDNGVVEDGSIQQSSRMKDIESLAAEQVNIAISRARNVLRDEAQKKSEVQVRQRRHKINAQQIKPTEELVTDPTCDTRSDENDNAQIGFVLISLITLFLIIKLVAKLGGFLLDFINQWTKSILIHTQTYTMRQKKCNKI